MLDEAYAAFHNDLPVLAAIALRTAFDASTEILGIHPALGFEEKLDALEKGSTSIAPNAKHSTR
jgi:hypothetical protein